MHFSSTEDTVVAVMGDRNLKSKVRSPYQQMIFADKTKCHYDLRIMTIRLAQAPNTTLYTRVLQFSDWYVSWFKSKEYKERCTAVAVVQVLSCRSRQVAIIDFFKIIVL